MQDKPLRSIPESQTYLGGISRTTLYQLRDSGLVRFVKVGRRSFVTTASLDEYVTQISA